MSRWTYSFIYQSVLNCPFFSHVYSVSLIHIYYLRNFLKHVLMSCAISDFLFTLMYRL